MKKIKAGQKLNLRLHGNPNPKTKGIFEIINQLGEDAESASFRVFRVRKDGETGILRQVKRENADAFIQRQLAAAACLRRLYSDEEQKFLFSILPDRTVWSGGADDWYLYSTKEPDVLRFDECREQILNDKKLNTDQKAERILQCIDSLVYDISLLHSKKIFHQDIKPQNFGFLRTGNLNRSIAYLFDIDTLYFAADPDYPNERQHTEGYWEGDIDPAANAMEISAQTDIYSIGAVLWYAFSDSRLQYTGGGDPANKLLQSSSLLRDMQCKTAVNYICEIIRRTLTPRKKRYESLEFLVNDLQSAITALQPRVLVHADLTDATPGVTAEDQAAAEERADSALRLKTQLLLFQHPLYETASDAPVIWIIGSGRYAEAFLDIALPLTQCFCGTPQICILSTERPAEKWSTYLNERPALYSFFSINGAPAKEAARAYGIISVSYFNPKDIKTLAERFPKPSYIFLDYSKDYSDDKENIRFRRDYSDDTKNIRLLRRLQKQLSSEPSETVFSTVLHKSVNGSKNLTGLAVIHCDARPEDELHFQSELERISRNIHWMWSSPFDSYAQTAESYLKPKNHLSSCACALSFPYKLRLLGITEHDIVKAAAQYAEVYANDAEKAELLEDVEHSRWVAERCCGGYTVMTAEEAAAIGRTTEGKRAACLVDRLLRTEINGPVLSDFRKEEWNTLDENRLADPLDKMSLRYHKKLTESGKEYIAQNFPEIQRALTQLHDHLHDHLKTEPEKYAVASQVFDGLNICIRSMRNGNGMKYAGSYAKRYEWLNDLLKADETGKQILDRINTHMKKIRPMFLYRDYRHIDRELTESLPFMLTYSDEKDLCVLLPDLNSLTPYTPEALQLLAPMMLLDPPAVRFVLYTNCTDMEKFKKIGEFIRYALLIADAKRLRVKKFRITLYSEKFISPPFAYIICGLETSEQLSLETKAMLFTEEKAKEVFLDDWNSPNNNSILQCPQEPLAWLTDAMKLPNAFCFCTDGGTYRFQAENCPSLSFIDQRMKKSMRRLSVEDLRIAYDRKFSYQDQPDFYDCFDKIYADYLQYRDQWALFQSAVEHESCHLDLSQNPPCTLEYEGIPEQTMPKIMHFIYSLKCLDMAENINPIQKRGRYSLKATVAENNCANITELLEHICENPDDEPEMKQDAGTLLVTLLSLNPRINMPKAPEDKRSMTEFMERQKNEQKMIRKYTETNVQFPGRQEMWLLTAQNSVNILSWYYTALSLDEFFNDISLTTEGLKASAGFRLLDEKEIMELIPIIERNLEEMQEEMSL